MWGDLWLNNWYCWHNWYSCVFCRYSEHKTSEKLRHNQKKNRTKKKNNDSLSVESYFIIRHSFSAYIRKWLEANGDRFSFLVSFSFLLEYISLTLIRSNAQKKPLTLMETMHRKSPRLVFGLLRSLCIAACPKKTRWEAKNHILPHPFKLYISLNYI